VSPNSNKAFAKASPEAKAVLVEKMTIALEMV
jgi:hypothetical protein